MAGAGAKKFPAFSKLSSDDVNNYLADQVIMRFATTAARDAAFGGVGEPTLAEGMFCYVDDTNVLQSYNGSSWVTVVNTDRPSGFELVTSAAVSGANPTISGAFSSDYVAYKIIFTELLCSNTTNFYLRMGTTAGAAYYWAGINREWIAASTTGSQGNATSQWATGIVGHTSKVNGVVELQAPHLAQPTTFSCSGGDVRTNGAGAVSYSGFLNNSTQYTSFSLLCDGAVTITSCNIRVYGYRYF